jgi:hypothetical protein
MVNAYKPTSPVLKNEINFKVPTFELKFYNISPSNEGTFIEIVDVDFILTGISCWLQSGTTSTKFHSLFLNNQLLLKWQSTPTIAGDTTSETKEIVFPDILIRKGTQLKLIATESGAQGLACNYSFLGHYI